MANSKNPSNILKTFGLAALILVVYLIFSMLFTHFYTRHGESVKVPKVEGMPAENAFNVLEQSDLEMVIVDSVYREELPKMTIVDQDPAENSNVKPGRKIYVTVNTGIKPKVKMPQLVNGGMNLAKVLIQNAGLKLGKIDSTQSELGPGLVLKQLYKGRPINANVLIDKGSYIDVVVSKSKRHSVDSTSSDIPNADPFNDGM
jgi:beta-lactam-binding protein with PASTA domain